ncbi:MAG: hypothetical protein K0R49_442 [Burkholderiales bacterium]|nr:hypothetical protein [Burkholderiales bacterium]
MEQILFDSFKSFYISKNARIIFIYGIIIFLISRGSSLVSYTFGIDDLQFWPAGLNIYSTFHQSFNEGRFAYPIVVGITQLISIDVYKSFMLSTLLFMASITITSIMVCKLWGVLNNLTLSLILVTLLILHPYFTDFFTWRIATFTGGIPFVMCMYAVLNKNNSFKSIFASTLIFVFGLGIHQIPLEFVSVALVLSIPLNIYYKTFNIKSCTQKFTVVILGTLVYIFFAKLFIAYGNIKTLGRDKIILLDNFPLVYNRTIELAKLFLFSDTIVRPFQRLALVLLCFISLFFIQRNFRQNKYYLVNSLLFLLSVFFGFILSVSLTIVSSAWMPVFRNLSSIGLVWAFIAVVAYKESNDLFKKVTLTSVFLISLGFIGRNNEILTDQIRVNSRDISMMNRIASDIGHLPDYAKIKRLGFVGTNNSSLSMISSSADLSTGWNNYGITLSLFAVQWNSYLNALYYEVTGNFSLGEIDDKELNKIKPFCKQKEYPKLGSVWSRGDLAVVCLGGSDELIKNKLAD